MEEDKDNIIRSRMQKIAKCVDGLLPQGCGFIVFAYQHNNAESEIMYASNSNKEDALKIMEEYINRCKNKEDN